MSKVGIANLQAPLRQHLRKDAPLKVRRATRKARDLRRPAPAPGPVPTDSLSVLLQDRAAG